MISTRPMETRRGKPRPGKLVEQLATSKDKPQTDCTETTYTACLYNLLDANSNASKLIAPIYLLC